MGLRLHFGPGKNMLPEPWQNLSAEHDIRKRLKFDNDSASVVVAEHVIEHVPYLQCLGFFREARRILEPGGVLRVAFPDISRFLKPAPFRPAFNECAPRYGELLAGHVGLPMPESPQTDPTRAALWKMLTGFGHQMAWTDLSAAGALLVIGFSSVSRYEYGAGQVQTDGHHQEVGGELAELETTVLEALK